MNRMSIMSGVSAICCFWMFWGHEALFGDSARVLAPMAFRPLEQFVSVKASEETLPLTDFFIASNWSSFECGMVAEKGDTGRPRLRMHIEVDHFGGEKNYPVGWPRTNIGKMSGIPWQDYDYFQFEFKMQTSRKEIPAQALYVKFSGERKIKFEKAFGKKTSLSNDEWVTVTMPVADVLKVPSMKTFGFFICDKDYSHKDTVDFIFEGFRLVRMSGCTVRALACQGVLFRGKEILRVGLTVDGKVSGNGVPFELSRNGKLLRHETLPVRRGEQVIEMDISELKLSNGDYVLAAFPQNPEKVIRVGFKVIDSPWRQPK